MVESPVEFHSQKPDNRGVTLCGFGCAEHSPGRDWRLDRGFFIAHGSSIRERVTYINSLRERITKIFPLTSQAAHVYHRTVSRKKVPPEFSAYFSKLGKKGGKLGGPARAAKMTPEERSASARKAVEARWAKVKAKAEKD
jgi:hypothetical protein